MLSHLLSYSHPIRAKFISSVCAGVWTRSARILLTKNDYYYVLYRIDTSMIEIESSNFNAQNTWRAKKGRMKIDNRKQWQEIRLCATCYCMKWYGNGCVRFLFCILFSINLRMVQCKRYWVRVLRMKFIRTYGIWTPTRLVRNLGRFRFKRI